MIVIFIANRYLDMYEKYITNGCNDSKRHYNLSKKHNDPLPTSLLANRFHYLLLSQPRALEVCSLGEIQKTDEDWKDEISDCDS